MLLLDKANFPFLSFSADGLVQRIGSWTLTIQELTHALKIVSQLQQPPFLELFIYKQTTYNERNQNTANLYCALLSRNLLIIGIQNLQTHLTLQIEISRHISWSPRRRG